MAERMISIKLLDDVTECPVCAESYIDPRCLPCIHTFCLKCIASWSGDKRPGDCVDCPLCRRKFTIPSKGVGELPKNIFIGKLLSMKEIASVATTGDAKICDWCVADSTLPSGKQNKAKVFCNDCQECLCERCCEVHKKMKISRAHRTIGLEEVLDRPTSFLPNFCDQHPTEDVKLYCLECHEALCVVCSITLHAGHKSVEIVKVVNEFRQDLSRSTSELESSIEKIVTTLKTVQDKLQNAAEQFSKVEMEINARADQLIATIGYHKQQLLADLNDMRIEKFKEIDTRTSELTQDKALLESLVKYSDELMNKGSNSDIARESRDLKLRSTELQQLCIKDCEKLLLDTVMTFKPSKILSQDDNNLIGKLRICHQSHDEILPDTVLTLEPSLSVTAENVVQRRSGNELCPTLKLSLNDKHYAQAVCSFNGQLYVTCRSIKQIKVFDTTTLKLHRKISIPDAGNELYGLTACSANKCLYVSDYDNSRVYRLTLLATDTVSTSKWSVDKKPVGLSVNRSQNLLVTCWNAKKIQEYTSDGSLVRDISDTNRLWQAVEFSSGIIAVSQVGPVHGVSLLTIGGRILRSCGSTARGAGPKHLNEPRSLVVDSKGFLLVADMYNDRIFVWNPELTEARQLPLPTLDTPLTWPRALCFEESRGRLYVGEARGQFRVLVFDSVSNLSSLFYQ